MITQRTVIWSPVPPLNPSIDHLLWKPPKMDYILHGIQLQCNLAAYFRCKHLFTRKQHHQSKYGGIGRH